jgi:hypothetical protein
VTKKRMIVRGIGLVLITLFLLACGGGIRSPTGVVKQYIELGRKVKLEGATDDEIDLTPILSEAPALWAREYSADSDEALIPLLSQCYDTISYEVSAGSGDEVGVLINVRVLFKDVNNSEMASWLSAKFGRLPSVSEIYYWVVREQDGWRILGSN